MLRKLFFVSIAAAGILSSSSVQASAVTVADQYNECKRMCQALNLVCGMSYLQHRACHDLNTQCAQACSLRKGQLEHLVHQEIQVAHAA